MDNSLATDKANTKSLQCSRRGSEGADLWDSLDSDTESLLQEKAYHRRELHGTENRNPSHDTQDNTGTKSLGSEDPHHTDPRRVGIMNHVAAGRSKCQSRPQVQIDNQPHDPESPKTPEEAEILPSGVSCDSRDELEDSLNLTEESSTHTHKYILVDPSSADTDAVPPPSTSFHLHSHRDQSTVPHTAQISDKAPKIKQMAGTQLNEGAEGHWHNDPGYQKRAREKSNSVTSQKSRSRNPRASRPVEDVVERNIATLGVNPRKQGSYVKAFEQRGQKTDHSNQSAEDTTRIGIPGNPDNAQAPQLTQLHKIDSQKNPSAVRPWSGDHPHQDGGKWVLMDDQESWTTWTDPNSISNRSSAPTFNPKINLNTPSKPAKPYHGAYNSPHTGGGINMHLPVDDAVGLTASESPEQTNKSSHRAPQKWPSDEANVAGIDLENEDGDALQPYGGAYPVLPPIAMPDARDAGLSSDRYEPGMKAIRRTCSEGYLAQLQKQNQKSTYKAYLLKDYKSLTKDVKLGGLGPSNTVAEDVAEKIRRQKLYSNVIRDQNKKIRRIPFLPARSPVSSEKDAVPRNKALEYAKTIILPKATQPVKKKPNENSENVFEHSVFSQLGLDGSQLATLELLKKRHEQEKQLVAHFTKLSAGPAAPSVNTH